MYKNATNTNNNFNNTMENKNALLHALFAIEMKQRKF